VPTVLLVIDVQQALVDALEPHRRAAFLHTLTSLIARARAQATPVLYVRHADDELRPNTSAWEIASEIAPHPGDAIIEKRHRDAFRETELHDALSRLGADHIVVSGMQTEFCVDATMREADRRGFRVTLIADGHATYAVDGASEEQIRAQVHRVARGRVAEIISADDLFAVRR
jgi:aminoglycoside 6'-N-acetyltransferase